MIAESDRTPYSLERFRVLLLASLLLLPACATRIGIPGVTRWELTAVERQIGSATIAEIENEENFRYWKIFLSDPNIRAAFSESFATAKEAGAWDDFYGDLDTAFRSASGLRPLQVARISPRVLRSLADQSDDPEEQHRFSATADAVQQIQSVVNQRIKDIGYRVAAISGRSGIRIIPEPVVGMNASVLVQFHSSDVYVGTEIALLAASDDELACVIGHELAHLTEGHTTRGAWVNLGKKTLTTLAAVAAAAAIAYAKDGQQLSQDEIATAVNLGRLTTFLIADVPLRVSGWNRSQEREADVIGTYYAWKAGFDPSACGDFMMRMARVEHAYGNDDGFRWWRTHPLATDRVVRIEKIVEQIHAGTLELR